MRDPLYVFLLILATLIFLWPAQSSPDLDNFSHTQNPSAPIGLEDAPHAIITTTVIVSVTEYQTPVADSSTGSIDYPKTGTELQGQKQGYLLSLVALISTPITWLVSIAIAVSEYVLVPALKCGFWIARVIVYRPAVLLYFLFLDKPLKALASVLSWILPVLAFVMAAAVAGTLIGGTAGWISGISLNALNSTSIGGSKNGKASPSTDHKNKKAAAHGPAQNSKKKQRQMLSPYFSARSYSAPIKGTDIQQVPESIGVQPATIKGRDNDNKTNITLLTRRKASTNRAMQHMRIRRRNRILMHRVASSDNSQEEM